MFRITSIALAAAIYGYSADAAGCHPTFNGGTSYSAGDTVSATSTIETTASCTCSDASCPNPNAQTSGCTVKTTTNKKHNYQCVTGPYSAYCSSAGFEPAGQFSSQAWIKELAECSGGVAITPSPTPAVWQTDSGCPGAYIPGMAYEPADKVSVVVAGTTYTGVYVCAAKPNNLFCGMSGYEPGTGQYWDNVWTLRGSCSGTISPTSSPAYSTLADQNGCPDAWAAGGLDGHTQYEEGDKVEKGGLVYQCNAWPYSGFCRQPGYEPMPDDFGSPGTGADPRVTKHWKEAWTVVGYCDGTIAPTSAPAFSALSLVSGCPDVYSTATAYEAGDQVAFEVATGTGATKDIANGWRFVVYECKDFPNSLYCSQDAYKPGSVHQNMAWTVKGYCDGTISPTKAPTSYTNTAGNAPAACEVELTSSTQVNKCYYEKTVTTTGVSCTCGYTDCPNPNGLDGTSTACKKTTVKTSCPSVDTYSSSTSYEASDVVRIGNARFKCKAWPYSLWCRNSAYKPSLKAGIWSDAWTMDGTCSTFTPTSSPSTSPSSSPTSSPTSFQFTMNSELRTAIQEYLSQDCTTDTACSARSSYSGAIEDWDVSRVSDFSFLFCDKTSWQPITGADTFNEALNWDTESATSMEVMFGCASAFNQPLSFDTAKVETMSNMFYRATAFNQPLSFDTAEVTNMYNMFGQAIVFNQPLTTFDTAKVKDMSYMFYGAEAFNQPLSFDTAEVTNMRYMFGQATVFNQPLSFDTAKVKDMGYMFYLAEAFNQPLSFDTAEVTDMSMMFYGAEAFNQDLCNFGDNFNSSTSVINMFFLSGCDDKTDPTSPAGPWCAVSTCPP